MRGTRLLLAKKSNTTDDVDEFGHHDEPNVLVNNQDNVDLEGPTIDLSDSRYRATSVSAASPEKKETFAARQEQVENDQVLSDKSCYRRDIAVPLNFVIARVRHRLDAGELYVDLMIFLPFLVMFVFFFLAGRNVEVNFFALQAVRNHVMRTEFPEAARQVERFRDQVLNEQRLWIERDKSFVDTANLGDWRSFFTDAVVGTIWDRRNPDKRHAMLAPFGQHYHVGALRVRAIRMRPDSCSPRDRIYPSPTNNPETELFPRTCYAKHDRRREDKSQHCNHTNPITGEPMFLYREASDVPGIMISAVEGVYHAGGHMVAIPFNYTYNEAMAVAKLIVDDECALADNWATRFLVIEYFVYTPATDSYHGIKFYTEILPGGWWFNQYMLRSFQAWSPQRIGMTVFEFAFLAFVIYYWVAFFYRLVLWRHRGGTVLKYLIEFWNILEIVNLVTFLVVFVIRWVWWDTSAKSNEELRFPFPEEYPRYLDRLMGLFGSQVYANSLNTILTFLKLLKYVRLNARLSILTRTLAMCQQSIIGVLVLFVFVIIGYGITAWTLFGINLPGFRNLGVAMSSLVRMLVGDIDYEAMRRENRFLSGAFFWSFIILALFLLLNFLIAIISEAFGKVNGKSFSQPLDETLLRTYQRWKVSLTMENVRRLWNGIRTGKTEGKMMRLALRRLAEIKEVEERKIQVAIAQQRALRKKEAEEVGEEFIEGIDFFEYEEVAVMMRRIDWEDWLDEDTYSALGDHYFDFTWDDIVEEYEDSRRSMDEVGKRHMMDTVEEGVKKVMGDDLAKVEQLDDMLTALEKEVVCVIEALQK